MLGLFHRLLPIALVILPLHASVGATELTDPAKPTVRIMQNHPTLFGQLADGESVFIRLAYDSAQPVRFQIEGYAEGKRVTESQSNPKPLYPASEGGGEGEGEGEALAWLAYEPPAAIDELQITILDDRWQPLAVKLARAQLRWITEAPAAGAAQPAWVSRLNREQQALAAVPEPSLEDAAEDLIPREWVLPLAWALVLAYLVLQVPMAIWFAGKWRLAARAPLIVTVPLFLYTIGALSAGFGLWPLALLLLAPFVLVYLVGLLAVRLVAHKMVAT